LGWPRFTVVLREDLKAPAFGTLAVSLFLQDSG
jgi:hypothetical protein